jgi:hypothetical protein
MDDLTCMLARSICQLLIGPLQRTFDMDGRHGTEQQLTDRPRQHARQVVHVGVDHGLWTALGFDRLSLPKAMIDTDMDDLTCMLARSICQLLIGPLQRTFDEWYCGRKRTSITRWT